MNGNAYTVHLTPPDDNHLGFLAWAARPYAREREALRLGVELSHSRQLADFPAEAPLLARALLIDPQPWVYTARVSAWRRWRARGS